jgi:hypothetical protein
MNKKYDDLPSTTHPEYQKLWRQKEENKVKLELYRRTWYASNKARISVESKIRRDQHPEHHRERTWKRNGILNFSYNDYLELLRIQANQCKICKLHMEAPNVDHDHVTGQVRGLLCTHCNKGLGCFQDNPHLLKNALTYLTR